MKQRWISLIAVLGLTAMTHAAESGRPELMAFPFKTEVTTSGTGYTTSTVGTDFVLSGTIDGDVAITATETCRVTLSGVTMTGALTISGDAVLWLDGASNSITNSSGNAITVEGALTIGGPGSATLTGYPAKNAGVLDATSLTMAGGSLSVVLAGTTKNACGVAVQNGTYAQLAGELYVTAESTNKQLGVALLKKNTAAVISGGILSITMAGEKGVGLSIDKSNCTATLSGGILALNMSGAAAKGVTGDGSFTMTGGFLTATMTGDALLEAYEDADENNYTVTISSSSLVTAGTYLVEDASYAYAVKCGTVTISGGAVRVSATGIAGRGIGGDEGMIISGGLFDMEVSGDCTDQLIEMLDEEELTTALDRGTATCLRMGSSTGTMAITGGTFYLTAEGSAGKGISCEGTLQIGTEGQETTPTDEVFYPDIQACTYGEKRYVAAQKQSVYTSLGTAVLNSSATDYPGVSGYVTETTGDDVDYTNPKAIKADGDLNMHGGRVRVYSKCDGGEGMESKTDMTIAGGLFEGTTYDDCLNASNSITISGGWLYCGSTGNDAIDSNGTSSGALTISGGVVLAFSATTPEVGIDVDDSSYLAINGGVVVSFGSATENAFSGSGSQAKYLNTSVTASTYTGKYLVLQGTSETYTVKIPECTASSLSLLCSIDGISTSTAPSATSTEPTSGDTGFHGVYISTNE